MTAREGYSIRPIGFVRSPIESREEAPMQGSEGAPDAYIELDSSVLAGVDGIEVGQELILLTWLHQSTDASSRRCATRGEGKL